MGTAMDTKAKLVTCFSDWEWEFVRRNVLKNYLEDGPKGYLRSSVNIGFY